MYAIVGACGGSCDYIRLSLYGPNGALMIVSPEKQPAVVIGGAIDIAGSYALELATPGCREQVCQAGFVIARHQANAAPAPSAALPPPLPHDAGAFLVHVASERTHAEALETYGKLTEMAPAALENKEPLIQEVDLGARGVWHRLRIGPPMSEAEAHALCAAIKAAGQAHCSAQHADKGGHHPPPSSAPAPKEAAAGPFDGTWTLAWKTDNCELPDGATKGRYPITVSAGEVTGQNGRLRGKIASNGAAKWIVAARVDGVNVRYTGNFSGTSASGKFSRSDGSCEGTFTARKRN
jgi:hypothetical protein